MANKSKTMLQIRRILQLLELGKTPGPISKELGISINTVKKYRNNFISSGIDFKQLADLNDISLQLISCPQKSQQNTIHIMP